VRENRSQVPREEYDGVLLEMLISEVGKMSISFFLSIVPLESSLPSPFIDSRGGYGLQQNPRGALEKKAGRAQWALLWRRAPVRVGHPWGVVVMSMMGRRDTLGAVEDV
jgi:hypothetical protein